MISEKTSTAGRSPCATEKQPEKHRSCIFFCCRIYSFQEWAFCRRDQEGDFSPSFRLKSRFSRKSRLFGVPKRLQQNPRIRYGNFRCVFLALFWCPFKGQGFWKRSEMIPSSKRVQFLSPLPLGKGSI